MRDPGVTWVREMAPRAALAAALLLSASTSSRAQASRRNPGGRPAMPGASDAPNRNPSIRERQLKMLEMEREMNRPPAREEAELALGQIGEDYERIQVINNRLMAAAVPARVLDYGKIADDAAEIGKRASRLKANLHLPRPEGAGKASPEREPAGDAEFKKLLLALDTALMRFVKSPVFQSTDVIDAEAARKASADLEAVIELSRFVGKCAAKAGKGAGKR